MVDISVIMSVYNEDNKMLTEAIDSILSQSFTNFEFVIFDDCTNKENKKILNDYAQHDKRIKLIINSENQGLTKNLILGVKSAKGKYIARMDSDDISLPERCSKQYDYLEDHPEISVVGTRAYYLKDGIKYIDKKDQIKIIDPEYIKAYLTISNCIIHSSVMIRADFLNENNLNYDINVKKSQDYNLWVHIAQIGQISVLNEYLVIYRMHDKQISIKNKSEQRGYADFNRLYQLKLIGLELSDEEKQIHLSICHKEPLYSLHKMLKWRRKLFQSFKKSKSYNMLYVKKIYNTSILKCFIKSLMKNS